MTPTEKAAKAAARQAALRERRRAAGVVPVTIWLHESQIADVKEMADFLVQNPDCQAGRIVDAANVVRSFKRARNF